MLGRIAALEWGRRGVRAGAAIVSVGALLMAPAGAIADGTTPDPASCSELNLTQPFIAWGDANLYKIGPGESDDNFDGGGWSLSGGANITTDDLADGSTGQVLDLPAGSQATSPEFCLNPDDPVARTMVRGLGGSSSVTLTVTDAASGSTLSSDWAGAWPWWRPSRYLQLAPSQDSDGQMVTFTFTDVDPANDVEVYDFYIDPWGK